MLLLMTRTTALCAALWLMSCSGNEEAGPRAEGEAGNGSSLVGGAPQGGAESQVGGSPLGGQPPSSGGSAVPAQGGSSDGATGGVGVGGTISNGGLPATGGAIANGGMPSSGGAVSDGGTPSFGGNTPSTGGVISNGGAPSAGGAIPSAGEAGSSGSVAGASSGGSSGEAGAPADPCAELGTYLEVPREERGAIADESFADVPLSAEQAEACGSLLWEDHATFIRETRQAEHDGKAITLGEHTLRYDFTIFGDKPDSGRSLFISLHGGGNAEPSVNDEQWQNQMTLYQPDEGIYLCPRAPTDTWNLWHEAHIDPLFERLIANLVVLEDVNPDRIYVMGYSAGGDGVYQLGPRMADHWAAAAAMAGHPNDAQPYSLRNIGFTIHVGGLDTAYDRNLVAQEWSDQLDELETADPGGYPHVVQVHADKPHWMDLEDAVAVPWMAEFTRNPIPETIVWYQDDVPHLSFYWLAVDEAEAVAQTEVRATRSGQSIDLETTGLSSLKLRLSDRMLDLSQPVSVTANGAAVFEGQVPRTIATLASTLKERGDPQLVFSGEVRVEL